MFFVFLCKFFILFKNTSKSRLFAQTNTVSGKFLCVLAQNIRIFMQKNMHSGLRVNAHMVIKYTVTHKILKNSSIYFNRFRQINQLFFALNTRFLKNCQIAKRSPASGRASFCNSYKIISNGMIRNLYTLLQLG